MNKAMWYFIGELHIEQLRLSSEHKCTCDVCGPMPTEAVN